MPELPEVETVRTQLDRQIAGRRLKSVEFWRTGREKPSAEEFVLAVTGKTMLGVRRRAKLLLFCFDDGTAFLGHLKMTGKFLFVDKVYTPHKHDRALFVFTDGTRMVWNDVRQFGYLHFVDAAGLQKKVGEYGPEPLEASVQELAERLKKPLTRKIKTALLDQETIAGIGNIYADEAAHRAGIRPTRRLATLTVADRLRLAKEIKKVLAESLAQKGTSANDYVDTNGERGGFLDFLRVYGRQGQACKKCSTLIKRIVLGGRGTHYCPSCQK